MTAALPHTAPAEVEALLARFDLGRAMNSLHRLCAPEFGGRRLVSEGHQQAQRWLAESFESIGLPVELFPFRLDATVVDLAGRPRLEIVEERRLLRHRIDYAEHPRSAPLADEEDSLRWATLESVPRGRDFDLLAAAQREQGVGGLLVPQQPMADGYLAKRIVARAPLELPVISIAAPLLPTLAGKRLRVHLPLRRVPAQGAHVIATLAGTDPELRHEPILLGAHYDGVGDDPGVRLPGAADNAAAVAVLLEVARVLASALLPRRPIRFVAFDGEEVDALGSRAYATALAESDTRPFLVNLDMAAQLHEAITVEPGASPARILAALDQAGEWLEQPLAIGTVSSDNRRFAAAGFPSVGIGLGGKAMHSPADGYKNVDPRALLAAGRLLLAAVSQLANG